eukprot:scaffold8587_cov97-Cylindrotheca_fusiformis.AAC.10
MVDNHIADDKRIESTWKLPKEKYHAHFDCFSGAAGDMLLASCLDSCENEEDRQNLLDHVVHCLENGMPELKDEFEIRMNKVWKGGMGSIAALHIHVDSILYKHRPAPVPMNSNKESKQSSGVESDHGTDSLDHSHGHSHSHPHELHPPNPSSTIRRRIKSTFRVAHPFREGEAEDLVMFLKHKHRFVSSFDCTTDITTNHHQKTIYVEHDAGAISTKDIARLLNCKYGLEVSHSTAVDIEQDMMTRKEEEQEDDENSHSHSHAHSNGLEHHSHEHSHSHNNNNKNSNDSKQQQQQLPLRNLPEIRRMLEVSSDEYIDPWVKRHAISAFTELAKAEAYTHGVDSIDAVHFHEVGAIDSIVDTVGTLIALHAIGVTSVSASKLPIGEGMVWTDHGCLPVPAPATLRLLIDMPVCKGPPGITGELVTPTGAALIRALTLTPASSKNADKLRGRPPDDFIVRKIGIGAGTKDFVKHPNILRLLLGSVMV